MTLSRLTSLLLVLLIPSVRAYPGERKKGTCDAHALAMDFPREFSTANLRVIFVSGAYWAITTIGLPASEAELMELESSGVEVSTHQVISHERAASIWKVAQFSMHVVYRPTLPTPVSCHATYSCSGVVRNTDLGQHPIHERLIALGEQLVDWSFIERNEADVIEALLDLRLRKR